jgi:hypothetical protein
MWNQIQGKLAGLDAWIAGEAAKRQAGDRAAGIARNTAMIQGDTEGKYRSQIMERITRGFAPPAADAVAGIESALGNQKGRARIASQYAPDMRRGQGGWTGRGTMEMINEGIATNDYVRRGVLPTAIVGGGALLTAPAQQLLQLMGFLQEGSTTGERTENSPLA